MAGDADIFINAVVDTRGTRGADTLNKRLEKINNAVDRSSTLVAKNGEIWNRHTITLRGTRAEINKIEKSIKVLSNTAKTVKFHDAKDATAKVANKLTKERKETEKALAEQRKAQEKQDEIDRKIRLKHQQHEIEKRNALANVYAAKEEGKPVPHGSMSVLTKGLPPKVAESYYRTWRESKRLFGQSDHVQRWANGMHKVSMAALAANMSALGLFFSMFSVINLMRQGVTSLLGPLADVGTMFETLAMSEAFGSGVAYDANKMVDAWERFTGLKSDIGATIAVMSAEILTDPAVWEAISTGVRDFLAELRKPEVMQAIKDVVIALANSLPKIAKEIPGIANFVIMMAPWLETLLPLAVKAAIAMPFLSLVTGVTSLTAAFFQGAAAILRFRAAYKSIGFIGALGGLAGGAGGIAGGLPVPVPTGGSPKTPNKPKVPKTPSSTSKIGGLISTILGFKVIDTLITKLKDLFEPLTKFKTKIVSILSPVINPKHLIRGVGGPLAALSLVEPVGAGSEMTLGPNGTYIMGSDAQQYIDESYYNRPSHTNQTINVNVYGNVTSKKEVDTIVDAFRNATYYG